MHELRRRMLTALYFAVVSVSNAMVCLSPVTAWRRIGGGSLIFRESDSDTAEQLNLPCGECPECRLDRSRHWAIRCMHEAQGWSRNCFITLTFNNDHLNDTASLDYRDFQLFMKRLRKSCKGVDPGPSFDFPIRFYMCGEYGAKNWRPHYHAVLFNFDFDDKVLWKRTKAGSLIFRSPLLEKLWPFGYSSIGELTFESAAYVARYVMKKRFGRSAEDYYRRYDRETGEVIQLVPEFNKMSLKPGIGFDWFEKYHTDVYPHDRVLVNSVPCSPPRYYDKLLQKRDPDLFEEIKFTRWEKWRDIDISNGPSVQSRTLVTEQKLSMLKRDSID